MKHLLFIFELKFFKTICNLKLAQSNFKLLKECVDVDQQIALYNGYSVLSSWSEVFWGSDLKFHYGSFSYIYFIRLPSFFSIRLFLYPIRNLLFSLDFSIFKLILGFLFKTLFFFFFIYLFSLRGVHNLSIYCKMQLHTSNLI
jgi:hypothetical protein